MAKFGACEFFYRELKKSNLLFNFEKFLIEAGFHAVRKDSAMANKMIKATSGVPIGDSSVNAIHNKFLELDDVQLAQLAAQES